MKAVRIRLGLRHATKPIAKEEEKKKNKYENGSLKSVKHLNNQLAH